MTKRIKYSIRLFLALALVAGLVPKVARADEGGNDRPIRLRATAALGPIGTLYSLGGVSINGRSAYGEQMIWGGELLQLADYSSASVSLDSVGQVALSRGATARLSVSLASSGEGANSRVLIVSLIKGDISVKLQPDAGAYIEACGSAFTATSGAIFRVETGKGRAAVKVIGGTLRTEPPVTRRIYEVLPVKAQLKVETKKEVPVQGKVTSKKTEGVQLVSFRPGFGRANVQMIDEGPQAGKLVEFTLSRPIGQFRPSNIATTDAQGIASVLFVAGPNSDSADVTATVINLINNENLKEEAVARVIAHIDVVKPRFWTKTKILAAVGAAAVIGICIVKCSPNKPLKQEPPPIIP